MDKKQLVVGVACGFMAWACKSMILKAVKKGEN